MIKIKMKDIYAQNPTENQIREWENENGEGYEYPREDTE